MTEIPDAVNTWLDGLTAAELDDVARILQRRAEDKRRQEWWADEDTTETTQSQSLDVHGDLLPEGVPAKATLTKKTINDNEYWYWQWRADDGTVTSKYKCPVNQS